MQLTNILIGTEIETENGRAAIGNAVVSAKRDGDTEEWNATDGCVTDTDRTGETAISTGGEESVVTKQEGFPCMSDLKE